MTITKSTLRLVPILLVGATLSACHYVKQDDYDAAMAELRGNDAALRGDLDALKADVASLRSELDGKLSQYDAKFEEMAGRLRVDMNAHFAYDDASVREEDKPALDAFAQVMREHHPDAVVTVEGFTDPAGSASYNKRLGQKRADAVKDYLVATGGLSADNMRAVSYGESTDRMIKSGAWGDDGLANRRVALVIDFVPDASMQMSDSGQTQPAG